MPADSAGSSPCRNWKSRSRKYFHDGDEQFWRARWWAATEDELLEALSEKPPLAKTGCHRRADLTHLALALDFGLHRTALAYCVATAAFVAVAVGSLMLRRRGPATGPEH